MRLGFTAWKRCWSEPRYKCRTLVSPSGTGFRYLAVGGDGARWCASGFPVPLFKAGSPRLVKLGKHSALKMRRLRACRFESCIGDITIILSRTAVLLRVIFFYRGEGVAVCLVVLVRGGLRRCRRIGLRFVVACSSVTGTSVKRFLMVMCSVVPRRRSAIIREIPAIIRCLR